MTKSYEHLTIEERALIQAKLELGWLANDTWFAEGHWSAAARIAQSELAPVTAFAGRLARNAPKRLPRMGRRQLSLSDVD